MTKSKNNNSSNRLSASGKEDCVLSGNATSEAANVECQANFEFDHMPFVKYLMHLYCEVREEKCEHITTSYLEYQSQEELELRQEGEWSWTELIIKSFATNNNNSRDVNCIQAYRRKNINYEQHQTDNKKIDKETKFFVEKRLLAERYYIDHYNYESTSTGTLEKVSESSSTSPSTTANMAIITEAAGTQLTGKENIVTNANLSSETKGNIKTEKGNAKENNKDLSHSTSNSEHNSTDNTETEDSNSAKSAITLQQRLRICLLCALGYIDKECTLANVLSLNWNTINFDEDNADKHLPVLHSTHIDQEDENKDIQVNNNICKFATDMPPEQRSSLYEQQIQAENFVSSDADICLSRKLYLPDVNTLTFDGNKELCEHDCEPGNDVSRLYFALHQNELCASAVCEWIEDVLEFIITNEFSVEQACCILTCAKELLSKLERIVENNEYEANGNIEENICAHLKDTLHTCTVEVHKNVKEKCHKQEEVQREMPDPDALAKLKARLAKDKLSKKQIAALEEELKHVPVITCTVAEDKIVEVERQITVGPYFCSAKEVEGIYEFLRDAVVNCWRLLHYVLCTNNKSLVACEEKEECHNQCTQLKRKMRTEFEEQQKLTQQKECTGLASNISETNIHREIEVIEPFCVIPLCTFLPENLLSIEHERQELLTNFTEGLLAMYEKEFIAEWEVIAHEECNARTALVQKIISNLQENKALAMSKNEYLQTQHALLTRLETKVEDNKLIERRIIHNECDVQSTSSGKNSNAQYNNNKKCVQENANNTKNKTASASAINTTNTTDTKRNNANVLPNVNKLKTGKMKTLPPKANASTSKTVLPRILEASASSSLEPSLPQTFTISNMFSKKADNVNSTDGSYEFAAEEFNLSNVLSRLATIEERTDQIELSASASKSASESDLRRKK